MIAWLTLFDWTTKAYGQIASYIMPTPTDLERKYVHDVYSRLAAYRSDNRFTLWPNVKRFLDQFPPYSIVADIGCGNNKYSSAKNEDCFLFGCDVCVEQLSAARQTTLNGDVLLGDALCLPYRDESMDGALSIAVMHHLSTFERRLSALHEMARVVRRGGRLMIYVWAYEQTAGTFSSQDVLVPWHLHEIPCGGENPRITFHCDSTKEQRIIAGSIGIQPPTIDANDERTTSNRFALINQITAKFLRWLTIARRQLPPALPEILHQSSMQIVTKVNEWNPIIGNQLSKLLPTRTVSNDAIALDRFANEMAQKLMTDAFTEAYSRIHDVTFYRYYHVFRDGELVELVGRVPTLRIIDSFYDQANWCVIVEKI